MVARHRPAFPDSLAFNEQGWIAIPDLNTGRHANWPNVKGTIHLPDGSKIAFFTGVNYLPQDTHNSADVYVYDFASQQMTLVSTLVVASQ
ncbi:MAG: hypothetical protein IPL02_04160 [Moraxellaceae bacterium]|nr:hypothetical protein [Moraxellaceae bacterium]